MKALISPNDVLTQEDGTEGYRVCETHPDGFEIASPLFWIDCEDSLNPNECIYINGSITGRTYKQENPIQYNMPVTDFGN